MSGDNGSSIHLQGVRVHNLQNIDLQLPLHKLIAITGVSGSGKSSLAFDTLYTEGQRRYIESFSAYARQFLDRLEKPDADRIDNIPPAIALKQSTRNVGGRSTIATTTELHDYLRLLFTNVGRIVCPGCGREIRQDSPETAADVVAQFAEGTRFIVGFSVAAYEEAPSRDSDPTDAPTAEVLARLEEDGFTRIVADGATRNLSDLAGADLQSNDEAWVVVDRLVAGKAEPRRIVDSLEIAFANGHEQAAILELLNGDSPFNNDGAVSVDGRMWQVHRFDGRLVCPECGREFAQPEPRLFSFNSPLGACPECRGFGSVATISFDHIVPDPTKSLREGAIVPWTTPAYRHELDELLDLAGDYGVPVDVPFGELTAEHRQLIEEGVPERNFGGLRGFYRWLERHKYKLSVRVFLNRWRAYEECPACGGDRLQPQALAVLVGDLNIAQVCRQTIDEAKRFFEQVDATRTDAQRRTSATVLAEIRARLDYLDEVGLSYLTLDRGMKSLSGGEAQRVRLTSLLGSSLVNTLYVLDEPSVGMHPRDSQRVVKAIGRLRDLKNTVIAVEHEDAFIRAADHVVDIGPAAGRDGGRIVFQGTPEDLLRDENSLTGQFLAGRAKVIDRADAGKHRKPAGWMKLTGAGLHNLKNITVEFPLGVMCAVTGVSGSGKSTLIDETLYPALCRALKQDCSRQVSTKYAALQGTDAIDEVVLVDQSPIGRSSRSNPVTYLKAFDEIRKLFAATPEAKVRNYTATQFSFNAAGGGRCPRCNGSGTLDIEMQFLADVSMTCPECHGTRFQREILEVKYRGLNIAEVLAMTVREAFPFFRGQRKLQKRLNFLKLVGLDYLTLGQPATTLSGGESQRLKLAAHMAGSTRRRVLFLFDEPTTGLHPADVATLLECFRSLLDVGHSIIVVEHDLDVIDAADHVIDLGPEAGDGGGDVVATGTPEEIRTVEESYTGRFLRSRDG